MLENWKRVRGRITASDFSNSRLFEMERR